MLMCRATSRGHQGAVVAVWGTRMRAGRPQEVLSKQAAKGPGKAPRKAWTRLMPNI